MENYHITTKIAFAIDAVLILVLMAQRNGAGAVIFPPILGLSLIHIFDVSLIKNVPRRTFIRLFPKYAKGTHLADRKAPEIIDYRRCRQLTIIANQGIMKLCVDGEIVDTEKVTFEIVPKALQFSVPEGI